MPRRRTGDTMHSPNANAWEKEALRLAEDFFRGFYEKTIHPKDMASFISSAGASWIGSAPGEFYPSMDEAVASFSLQRDKADVPYIYVGKGRYIAQPITDEVILVLCEVPLRTDPASGILLSEIQRGSILFRAEEGRLRLCHIHVSNPWTLMKKEPLFPKTAGRVNYEYLQQLLALEKLAAYPTLTDRQKLVLSLLSQGRTYEDIGTIMNISSRTVRYHVSELLRKFHAATKAELLSLLTNRKKEEGLKK